jgi:dipeptidyl aminopeptidase/acylaminoacyl peptidase
MRRLVLALFVFALVVFVLILPALAQTKHPFTFEDMMALKRVGEPIPSPDGKWVVFSVVDVDLAANTKTPHIWIVPLNSAGKSVGAGDSPAQERILIADQDGQRPRFAPNGKRFAFISTKEGGSQIWIADFDSAAGRVTATHKLTSIATEADGEIWSPDGKNIAFVSSVYPECDGTPDAEAACNAKKLGEAAKSKVKAQIFTRLLYRHWNAYTEGKRSHIFVVSPEGGQPRDLTPGDYESPVFSLGGQDNYAFSPDGQELCYTSNHDTVEATSTNNDLWIVPVNGGAGGTPVAPKNITADNPASDSTPLYSPDGKYIAYRAQQRPGYESDQFLLALYDRTAGKRLRDLVGKSDWEDWVGSFVWAPNSSEIFFVGSDDEAQKKGQKLVWDLKFGMGGPPTRLPDGRVLMRGAMSRRRITGGYDDDLAVSPDGKTLLFTHMALEYPTEIRKVDVSGKIDSYDLPKGERLTHNNDSVLSQVAMSPLETFWFEGAHGDKVQGFLVKPPNFDPAKKYPVKFLIHGGPQGAWGDDWSYRWNAELFAANGYVVIMINFHGSTGYGQKFIDAINGDWGGAPFEDLMKGLDYAEEHYPFIDKNRECALGASYGGYMANWILGHTNRFKCIVSHDGMFNTDSAWGTTEELWFNEWEFKGTPWTNRDMYRKWSPHLAAPNFKTPTLVIHGQRDYRLDVSEGLQLFTTLQRLGVPSKMLYFPDEGHWVLKPQNSQLWWKTVNEWVDQWTK